MALALRSRLHMLDQTSLLLAAATITGRDQRSLSLAHWPGTAGARFFAQQHGHDINAMTHEDLADWLDGHGQKNVPPGEKFEADPRADRSADGQFLAEILSSHHASQIAVLAGLDMVSAMRPDLTGAARRIVLGALADQAAAVPLIDDLAAVVMHDFEARAAAHQLLRSLA
jgi:hypothetical protein